MPFPEPPIGPEASGHFLARRLPREGVPDRTAGGGFFGPDFAVEEILDARPRAGAFFRSIGLDAKGAARRTLRDIARELGWPLVVLLEALDRDEVRPDP